MLGKVRGGGPPRVGRGVHVHRMASSGHDGRGEAALKAPPPELGEQLKCMFGEMSAGPMPSRLLELANALEDAFQRGDLFECASRRSRVS